MLVVVGLGNPGPQYAASRHNLGFVVVEELARRWRLPLGPPRDGVRTTQGLVAGTATELVEPQMYMNLSGAALSRLSRVIDPRALVVVHDDLDLPPGCVRVKQDGGTAGHRGLESIVASYGSDFTRIRVGIGHPARGVDVAEFVLTPFEPSESEAIQQAVERAADAVECILREGVPAAMRSFNVRAKSSPAATAEPMGRK